MGGQKLDLEWDETAQVVYVYGLDEALQLTAADVHSQHFDAMFHKNGTFTGTVFLINTGQAHPNLEL